MLQSIRDKATGWIAYVIIGLISIPFMFFGVQSYLGAGGKTLVAKVNGAEIGVEIFQQALQQQQVQLREMFGGNLPEGLIDGDEIKRTVIDRLISSELMMQYATDNNFNVSDTTVADTISKVPVFQENGVFSPEKYDLVLAQQRINRGAFEQQIRGEAVLNQFPAAVSLTEIATQDELDLFQSLKNEKRTIEYLKFVPEAYTKNIQVSDQDVADYYENNSQAFMLPEQLKVAYVLLDESELAQSVETSEEILKEFYEQDIVRYQTAESLTIQRILLAFGEDLNQESKDRLRDKASEISERLSSGEDFGEIAIAESDDSLSAKDGGRISGVRKGDFSQLFEETAFSLKEGEVSEPFETSAGYELVKLISRIDPAPIPFNEVKTQVEVDYRQGIAEKRFIEKSEQLATLSYEMPDSLDGAANEVGLAVKESAWFSRDSGDGVTESPVVRKAAFSETVKGEDQNSDLIEIQPGQQIVLRVLERSPAAPQELSAVSENIEKIVREKLAQEKLLSDGMQSLTELQDDKATMAAIADRFSLSIDEVSVGRGDRTTVPPTILKSVFRLTVPDQAAKGQSLAGVQVNDGSYWLLKLTKVSKSSQAAATDATAASVSAERVDRVVDAISQAVEGRAKIEIFDSALN